MLRICAVYVINFLFFWYSIHSPLIFHWFCLSDWVQSLRQNLSECKYSDYRHTLPLSQTYFAFFSAWEQLLLNAWKGVWLTAAFVCKCLGTHGDNGRALHWAIATTPQTLHPHHRALGPLLVFNRDLGIFSVSVDTGVK